MQWTLLDHEAVLFSIYNLPLWTLCCASKQPGLGHINSMSLLQQQQEDVSKDALGRNWSECQPDVHTVYNLQHWRGVN